MLTEGDTVDKVNRYSSKAVAADQRDGFATAVEAGKFLRLSRQAVSQMALKGRIPARRYGRSLRIPWDWLLEEKQRARQERPAAVVKAKAR
jgi:hypothetical protein